MKSPAPSCRPLHITTTFMRDPDNQYRKGYIYGRADNATVRQAEDRADATSKAARPAWCSAPAWRRPPPRSWRSSGRRMWWRPSHVLGPAQVVAGGRARSRHRRRFVDAADPRGASAPPCSPARPGWSGSRRPPIRSGRITDIAAAASIAHAAGALLAVDSTVRDAGADAAARARRRHRHALGDQIPQRPFGRDRRRAASSRATRRRAGRASQRSAQHARRASSDRSRRGCCCAACARCTCACAHQCAIAPCASPSTSRAIRASRRCSIPGCRPTRATRSRRGRCRAASAACCRSRVQGRRGRGHRRGRPRRSCGSAPPRSAASRA